MTKACSEITKQSMIRESMLEEAVNKCQGRFDELKAGEREGMGMHR